MAQTLQVSDELLDFDIMLNGSKIKDTVEVLEIAVDMEINMITTAIVTIQDGGAIGAPNETYINSENKWFIPGVAIEIKIGYGGKRTTAFKGIIIAQRLRVKQGSSQVIITCKDEAFQMKQGRFNSFYQDRTDSDALKSIIGRYGVSTKVDASTVEMPSTVQFNSSDWEYIVMRAEANNMMVITDKNTVIIKKIDLTEVPKFEINTTQYVIDIDLNLNSEYLTSGIELSAWNPSDQEETLVSMNAKDTLKQGNLTADKISGSVKSQLSSIYSSSPLSDAELKIFGESIATKSVLSKIQGKISIPGTTEILAGDIIALSGFSARFNGNAFISRVQHLLEDGDWITTLFVGASKKFHESVSDTVQAGGSGLIPASNGIQIGTVQKIHEDPAAEHRVLVTLPSFKGEGQNEGLWARLAFPYASKEAGFFFYPEVGDEVLVNFLNNDPRFPVITGALYSKKNIPKEEADEKNQFKSIFSKSGIEIRFDDEDKILHIATPEGHSITLDNKEKAVTIVDVNENQFTMNDSGIEMKSPKDIHLKADGNISMQATGNIDLKATGDLTGDGMNVTLSAQTGFTGKGNATAEISASGQTTVKGAMVMIN